MQQFISMILLAAFFLAASADIQTGFNNTQGLLIKKVILNQERQRRNLEYWVPRYCSWYSASYYSETFTCPTQMTCNAGGVMYMYTDSSYKCPTTAATSTPGSSITQYSSFSTPPTKPPATPPPVSPPPATPSYFSQSYVSSPPATPSNSSKPKANATSSQSYVSSPPATPSYFELSSLADSAKSAAGSIGSSLKNLANYCLYYDNTPTFFECPNNPFTMSAVIQRNNKKLAIAIGCSVGGVVLLIIILCVACCTGCCGACSPCCNCCKNDPRVQKISDVSMDSTHNMTFQTQQVMQPTQPPFNYPTPQPPVMYPTQPPAMYPTQPPVTVVLNH